MNPNHVELLVGEVLLGDITNKYLYVGDSPEDISTVADSFINRIVEEGYPMAVRPGQIVVNETQKFMFVHKDKYRCLVKGMSFNRIFINVCDNEDRDQIKRDLAPGIVCQNGDFV